MPVSISGDGAITGLELESFADVDVGSGAADGDVLTYDATGDLWIPQGVVLPAGIGSNVVSGARTTTFSTTSTSYVTVTDVTATITPSSASSKVLVVVSSSLFGSNLTTGSGYQMIVARNGTQISGDPFVQYKPVTSGERSLIGVSAVVLDSPATTSATTYDLRLKAESTTTAYAAYRSSIVAIEVAA